MQEVVIGIAGAAGDGLDKSGDTLAKTAGRLGLHVYAYNSYQSIIRGGHIWLRVRIGSEKVYSHGDKLTALIALNQDSIERHAGEVDEGGAIIYNADRLKFDPALAKGGVKVLPVPMSQVTAETVKTFGPIQPIMQNTVLVGTILHFAGLSFEEAQNVIIETFQHKGQKVIDLNVALLRSGFEYAKEHLKSIDSAWTFSRKRRPFVTGNEAIAIGAVAAGCKFYSAYPMTPASSILHWMANHASKVGVCVKQCEDELSVVNMAIGAGIAGVRSMCATSGGGFALMTEAIGMAGIMEVPVVCVEVQRGGPSTGLPTKTEQADLYQVLGASQGEFPRFIVAPKDVADCFDTTVEAFNIADRWQMPALIISDLLLSEHPETVDPEAFKWDVPIDRGEIVAEWPESNGKYKRFALTDSGVSPRALPGTPNTLYVSASDDHDEESILISDMFTAAPVRRKMHEKRLRKLDGLLKELPAPKLEGPEDAELTVVTWGSTYGPVKEALALLAAEGIKANHLNIKYIFPFHSQEVREILSRARKKVSIELNYTSMMARYLRGETGIGMDAHINKYDGEPFEPAWVAERIKAVLDGKPTDLAVTEEEAREIAYHYLRTHYLERLRPGKLACEPGTTKAEATWRIPLVSRSSGKEEAVLTVGATTGRTYSYKSLEPVS